MYTITYRDKQWLWEEEEARYADNEILEMYEENYGMPVFQNNPEIRPYDKVIQVIESSPKQALKTIQELIEQGEISQKDFDVALIHNATYGYQWMDDSKRFSLHVEDACTGKVLLLIRGVDAFTPTAASKATIDIVEALGFKLTEDQKREIYPHEFLPLDCLKGLWLDKQLEE